MSDVGLSQAHDLVCDGIARSGIPLSANLEHYLCITLLRYMREPLPFERLTVRTVRAFDERATAAQIRALADECLIGCSLFAAKLRRVGGSVSSYVGLGRTAYEAAGLTEQAWGFPHMRDVLAAAAEADRGPADVQDLLEAARAGSVRSRAELARSGVILFTKH